MNLQGGGLVLFPTSDEASFLGAQVQWGCFGGPHWMTAVDAQTSMHQQKLVISKKYHVCAESIDSLGTLGMRGCKGCLFVVRIIELEAEYLPLQLDYFQLAPGSSKWPNLIPQQGFKEVTSFVHDHLSRHITNRGWFWNFTYWASHCSTSTQNKSEQEQ